MAEGALLHTPLPVCLGTDAWVEICPSNTDAHPDRCSCDIFQAGEVGAEGPYPGGRAPYASPCWVMSDAGHHPTWAIIQTLLEGLHLPMSYWLPARLAIRSTDQGRLENIRYNNVIALR